MPWPLPSKWSCTVHCVLGLAARASVCISLRAWATVIWVLVHVPLSSKSWCTGQCVHISSRMGHGPLCSRSWCTGHCVHMSLGTGQCGLGLISRATVFQVLVHEPLCSRSWCTGHCGLGPGERTGHCALGLDVEVVFEVFAHGRICSKSWFTGHFVLSLGDRALVL